jgi:hypothetical protein
MPWPRLVTLHGEQSKEDYGGTAQKEGNRAIRGSVGTNCLVTSNMTRSILRRLYIVVSGSKIAPCIHTFDPVLASNQALDSSKQTLELYATRASLKSFRPHDVAFDYPRRLDHTKGNCGGCITPPPPPPPPPQSPNQPRPSPNPCGKGENKKSRRSIPNSSLVQIVHRQLVPTGSLLALLSSFQLWAV